MLSALHAHPDLQQLLPFAHQFYGAPSVYMWIDCNATSHDIAQGEGGEQGDLLMPALYALAQQPALHDVQAALREGEAIFAYPDDTYIVAAPERVQELYECYRAAHWVHARAYINLGKTRIWNAAGEEPRDVAKLQHEGSDTVWVGDWSLPQAQQGLIVLGAPIGSEAYVQRQLQTMKTTGCLRGSRPLRTCKLHGVCSGIAHARAPTICFAPSRLPSPLRMPTRMMDRCLPCRRELLACHSVSAALGCVELWPTGMASWMDTLPVIHTRAPGIAARLLALLRDPSAGHLPSLTAAVQAAAYLHTQGFEAPAWGEAFVDHAVPIDREDEPEDFLRGWQRRAARACDERALETHLPELTTASRALLLSQAGPHAARVFTVLLTWDEFTVPSPLLRVLLLRRLRPRPQPLFLPWHVGRLWGPPSGRRHVGCPSFAGLASGARHRPGLPGSGRTRWPKCQAGGHEPPRAGPRRPTHRGRLQRAAALAWLTSGS